MRHNRGFTLIELVLVITVLGILAVAALPSFINVSTQARQSAMSGVVGAVRTGASLFRANDLVANGPPGVYPATLDAAAAGTQSTAAPEFGNVLQQPVADAAWSKNAAGGYVYNLGGGQTCTYTYTAATGAFLGVAAGGATCP